MDKYLELLDSRKGLQEKIAVRKRENDVDLFNQNKLLYHIDRLDKWVRGKEVFPITVEVDISNICNHDCVWCTFQNFRRSKTVLMPQNLLFQLIDDVAQCGVKAVLWTGGGEPLTHPGLISGIKRAWAKGLKSGLFTNGSLLKADMMDTLLTHSEFVRISLDASTAETHAKVHNTKDQTEFEKIINNIRNLVAKKKELGSETVLGVAFLVYQKNYQEIVDAANLARDLGVDYIQYKPIIMWKGPQIDADVFIKARKFFEKAKEMEDNRFKIFVINYKFNDIIDKNNNYGRIYDKCYGHPFVGTVSADGKVYLCCHSKGVAKYCLGDLKERSFQEIWRGDERRKAIESIILNQCQPLCKLHEINKLLHFIIHPKNHKNFL